MLVKPANFLFNIQTGTSNAFQQNIKDEGIKERVEKEFDNFAKTLTDAGVNVVVFEDTEMPIKPDAIFPNNWVSFHADGTVILYPMHAENRQFERRSDIIDSLKKNFTISKIIDLSHYEKEGKYLEGTGSIIFDHKNKIAYACISPRTDKSLLIDVCSILNYQPISFSSVDENAIEIYHTNVMMCVGDKFAVICLESIPSAAERMMIKDSLEGTGHSIVDISFAQMNSFAGNMLEVEGEDEQRKLVMSMSAFKSLNKAQKLELEKHCQLLPLEINTIETIGGGSARCMIAEIFLPGK